MQNGSWKFPADVPGWLTEAEGRKLAELAAGKRVLEIGSFKGRSTICLAQTARALDCIDPMDGRATPEPGDTLPAFKANLARYGVGARLFVGTTADVAPDLDAGAYDLVFIDGDHSDAAVAEDIQHARRLLAPGGLLVFHDYRTHAGEFDGRWDPHVTQAVERLLSAGAVMAGRAESLAALRLGGPREKPLVMLAMPRRGRLVAYGAAQAQLLWPTHGACRVLPADVMSSILDHGFNMAWAGALNARADGVTHFALIHADVAAGQGWLDVLLAEMARTGADVVAAATIPLKDRRGLTSTALESGDPWNPRRLALAEVHALPETFGDPEAGGELLLNTGLWLCDLRKPWVDTPEPLVFQSQNRLVRVNGRWRSQVRSEDWEFSRAARARGAVLVATRKVSVNHVGEAEYPSEPAWGEWQTDQAQGKPGGSAVGAAPEPEGAPCTA